MSKIAFNSNPLGTGTFTIASPNSNSNRTFTLPDTTGTVLTSAGGTMKNLVIDAALNGSGIGLDINAATRTGGEIVARVVGGGATGNSTAWSVDSSGRVTIPFQPAFQAYGVGGGTFSSGSVHIYPSTRFNIGNHYNTANGTFTAPIAGVYIFGWTQIANPTNDVYRYRLRVNGTNLGDVHLRIDTTATGSEYGTNGVYTFPVNLSSSDSVNIFYESDLGTSDYPSGNSPTNDYPLFWGYLLG